MIQAKFEDALHGRAEEYLEWLDFVEAPAEQSRVRCSDARFEAIGRITAAA